MQELEQLDIFDIIYEFDETKANWIDVSGSHFYCVVMAIIPEKLEDHKKIHYDSYRMSYEEYKKRTQLWDKYKNCIFSPVEKVSWEMADEILRKHHKEQTPCKLTLRKSNSGKIDFIPEQVIEYL